MRKLLAAICAMLFLNVSFAEESVYSNMTDDDLLMNLVQIQDEMAHRELNAERIVSGIYVVGTDIRSGRWEFTTIDNETGSRILFKVYESVEAMKTDQFDSVYFYLEDAGGSWSIRLEDGMIFELDTEKAGCLIRSAEDSGFVP